MATWRYGGTAGPLIVTELSDAEIQAATGQAEISPSQSQIFNPTSPTLALQFPPFSPSKRHPVCLSEPRLPFLVQ